VTGIRFEPRSEVHPWIYVLVPIVSVVLALLVGSVFLLLSDLSPPVVYRAMVRTSFTSGYGLADTLVSATPLILTGLAALVSFRVKLWNIGAEGQLYMGAIFASGVALALGPGVARPVHVVAMLLAGMVGGVALITIPALARAWLGTSEIITTLLLNFVALFLMSWLIFGSRSFWRDPGATNFPQGRRIPPAADFPRFGTTRVHLGLLVALAAVVVVWFVLTRTRFGYQMRVLGDSGSAARYAGIPVRRTVVLVLLASGALGGLAGATQIGGLALRLEPNGLAVGLGFAGIIVASLARLNPFGVIVVAILLGGVRNAGSALQSLPGTTRVPIAIAIMLEGAILLFALGGELFVRYRLRIQRGTSDGRARRQPRDRPADAAPTAASRPTDRPAAGPAGPPADVRERPSEPTASGEERP
jgi:general nucleoside transport system permease protein